MNQCGRCRVCGWKSYNVEQLVLEWTGFGGGIASEWEGQLKSCKCLVLNVFKCKCLRGICLGGR